MEARSSNCMYGPLDVTEKLGGGDAKNRAVTHQYELANTHFSKHLFYSWARGPPLLLVESQRSNSPQ